MITEKTISDFLSCEYKEFAMYSIEGRAIPSVVDGFKPTQRKIIHISNQIWRTGNEKNLKVFQLAGKVASDAFYHHGNTSLENAIVTMAQKFKNNAATKMSAVIEVRRIVDLKHSCSILILSFPYAAAMGRQTITPIAALSVTVAHPE